MNEVMALYSRRILALAADIPLTGRLDAPMATAKARSPQCGSTVNVDLDIEDGRITRFAQHVLACALGQASAAVLGAQVMGANRAMIARGRDDLQAMLKGGPVPAAPWQDLAVLQPAVEFGNRHASIMLAWDATLEAMDLAMKKAG